MKIYIGSDHQGYKLKETLKVFLEELGHSVNDKGPMEFVPGDDYPDFIRPVAEAVGEDTETLGIVIGNSGQGEAICANRVRGVRAVVFYGPIMPKAPVDISGRESKDQFEIIKLARFHNNANIISLGANFISDDEAREAVRIFVETLFSGDERHIRRNSKLDL